MSYCSTGKYAHYLVVTYNRRKIWKEYVQLNHFAVHPKLTQHYQSTVLQQNYYFFFIKRKVLSFSMHNRRCRKVMTLQDRWMSGEKIIQISPSLQFSPCEHIDDLTTLMWVEKMPAWLWQAGQHQQGDRENQVEATLARVQKQRGVLLTAFPAQPRFASLVFSSTFPGLLSPEPSSFIYISFCLLFFHCIFLIQCSLLTNIITIFEWFCPRLVVSSSTTKLTNKTKPSKL